MGTIEILLSGGTGSVGATVIQPLTHSLTVPYYWLVVAALCCGRRRRRGLVKWGL